MIEGELQTEDGFQIGITKQEPSLVNVKREPEDDNPDRCIVCNEGLAANQMCGSGSGSETSSSQPQFTADTSSTVRRNPSRSAKRNILYRGDDSETDLNKEDNSLNGKIIFLTCS